MNTQTHILIGLAVAGKHGDGKINAAAALGGFIPDLVLYSLVLWEYFVLGHDLKTIFDVSYFTPLWQTLVSLGHSFPLWGMMLALSAVIKSLVLKVFCRAGLAHLLFDFPFHHDDAHMQFWPMSDWRFESPVSYWDYAHYGNIVSILEAICLIALAVYLWCLHKNVSIRILVAVLVLSLFLMHVFYMLTFGSV